MVQEQEIRNQENVKSPPKKVKNNSISISLEEKIKIYTTSIKNE